MHTAIAKRTARKNVIRFHPAYPNAATRDYIISKVIDYALTVAASAGLITAILFLMMI